MTRISLMVVVRGKVQGVSFRAHLRERADHFGVSGWVRNRGDGSVEALLQGEEEAVRRVLEWARVGPPRARVDSVSTSSPGEHQRQSSFRVIP